MAAQRDAKGYFLKGHGAPGPGRPPGSTNRNGLLALVDAFVKDLEQNAEEIVERLRVDEPAAYANIVSKLLPRELVLHHVMPAMEPEQTEEELLARVHALLAAKAKEDEQRQQPH